MVRKVHGKEVIEMVNLIVFADETPESKVAQDLIPFFEAVIEEVARHVPEKGYGYRDPDWAHWFANEAVTKARDYYMSYGKEGSNVGEALDATAFEAFAWLHETGKLSIKCAELRRDQE